MDAPRIATAALLCVALSGCHATLYGSQSSSGGTVTTTTSGQVGGSAKLSSGKVSFSSGQPVSPSAPGGTLKLSGSAAGVLVAGLVLIDLVRYIAGAAEPKPLAPDARIAETCSCYKKPDSGYEIRDTR
jgi:hypothetical protein